MSVYRTIGPLVSSSYKNAEPGSELGSVGLAETQVFFVWPNESEMIETILDMNPH